MILFVGLGNPGEHFQLTRHNIGFSILDEITTQFKFPVYKNKFHGSYTKKKFKEDLLSFNDGNPLTSEQEILVENACKINALN